MKVGFIGLGNMGSGMAANLIRAGHEVTVYNRTPRKAQKLVEEGARHAAQVARSRNHGANRLSSAAASRMVMASRPDCHAFPRTREHCRGPSSLLVLSYCAPIY